jgi:pimeloyl-ACP methyl ester carboxylesterase
MVLLLPAGLDRAFQYKDRMLRMASLIEGKSQEEAIESVLSDPERVAGYLEMPWLRDFDQRLLAGLNPVGVPRAIREIIEDYPIRDREELRAVTAPTLIIAREGDDIHPAEVARILADIMPNAELMMFEDAFQMYTGIPQIVERVRDFVLS